MKVIFVRHGEPRYDEVESRGYFGMGHELGKLTELGEEQAKRRASDPRFKDAQLIVASPYTRALQTAAIISRITHIPLTVENDVHEWMPDVTHRFEVDNWDLLWKEYWNSKGIRNHQTKYHWETTEQLGKRVKEAVLKYRHLDKIIVVCHGLAIASQTFFDDILHHCDVREVEYL